MEHWSLVQIRGRVLSDRGANKQQQRNRLAYLCLALHACCHQGSSTKTSPLHDLLDPLELQSWTVRRPLDPFLYQETRTLTLHAWMTPSVLFLFFCMGAVHSLVSLRLDRPISIPSVHIIVLVLVLFFSAFPVRLFI